MGSAKLACQRATPSSFLPSCDWDQAAPTGFRHLDMGPWSFRGCSTGAVMWEGAIVVILQGAPDQRFPFPQSNPSAVAQS